MRKILISLLALTATAVYAETWITINDTDAVKIERTNTTKKEGAGFTGTFRKIDKATKEVTPLVFAVDCSEKFYELKTIPKPGDDPTVISTGIANPDHKLYAYIEKGCK